MSPGENLVDDARMPGGDSGSPCCAFYIQAIEIRVRLKVNGEQSADSSGTYTLAAYLREECLDSRGSVFYTSALK